MVRKEKGEERKRKKGEKKQDGEKGSKKLVKKISPVTHA